MSDFFTRQEQARRRTGWLVVLFILAVLGITLTVYAACFAAFSHVRTGSLFGWDPTLFLWAAGSTLAVIFGGSLMKMAELSSGGGAVATMLGGERVEEQTKDPLEQKLRNVVEEMAIASGVPVPEIYVLRGEQSINAFAAGHSTSDAAIGVTRGCLQHLSRDELQGVIAHEFSHILNGDMRLNLRLIGLLYGILCLAMIGRFILRHLRLQSSSRNKKGGNPLPLLGLILLVVGSIGVFFGRLIQSAISRQREHLADAAAVQFTRNPGGLAGALKKIAGFSSGSQLESDAAEAASHLFFSDAMSRFFSFFATHPPIEERIRLLDPAFDGKLPSLSDQEVVSRTVSEPEPARPTRSRRPPNIVDRLGQVESGAWSGIGAPPPLAGTDQPSVQPRQNVRKPDLTDLLGGARPVAAVTARVGQIPEESLRRASHLLASLPGTLPEAVNTPFGASCVVYALLLSNDASVRRRQLDTLLRPAGVAWVEETLKVWPAVQGLNAVQKLPLVDLAMPALRTMSPAQYRQFESAVRALAEADLEISLFEYTLQKVLRRHLGIHFGQTASPAVRYRSFQGLEDHVAVLLSLLAYCGQDGATAAATAFRSGADKLPLGVVSQLLEPSRCTLTQADAALDALDACSPLLKKQLLEACAAVVAHDGQVVPTEAELLRAVADTLGCPMPL